jgi:hypothetical protein
MNCRETKRRDGEVMAAQPEDRNAEQHGAGDGEKRPERETRAEWPMELRHGDRGAVSTETIKG